MPRRKGNTNFDELFRGLTEKQTLFLRHFLDAGDLDTYMNASGSARAAGLSPGYGSVLKKLLSKPIKKFLAECGLDENSLKAKTVELLHARETKIMTVKGRLEEWELPPGARIMAVSSNYVPATRNSAERTDYQTVLAIDVEAKSLQHRALETALRMQELLTDNVKVSGLEGLVSAVATRSKDLLDD